MMNLELGNILFVRGHEGLFHPVDDAIKLGEEMKDHSSFDKSYTHVCIYIGNGEVAEAQGGRLSGKGKVDTYTGDYDIGTVDISKEDALKVVTECSKEYGLHYGWDRIGQITENILLGTPLPVEKDPHKPICTQFVKMVFFNAIGLDFGTGDTPEELSRSKHITMNNGKM